MTLTFYLTQFDWPARFCLQGFDDVGLSKFGVEQAGCLLLKLTNYLDT